MGKMNSVSKTRKLKKIVHTAVEQGKGKVCCGDIAEAFVYPRGFMVL